MRIYILMEMSLKRQCKGVQSLGCPFLMEQKIPYSQHYMWRHQTAGSKFTYFVTFICFWQDPLIYVSPESSSHFKFFHLFISVFNHLVFFYLVNTLDFVSIGTTFKSLLTDWTSSALLNTVRYTWLFLHCVHRGAMCWTILIQLHNLFELTSALLSASAYRATRVLFCVQHCLNFILFTTKCSRSLALSVLL